MTQSRHAEDAHPVMLLPWYVTGTLTRGEHAEVAAHLEVCAQCRAELESLRAIRLQVQAASDEGSAPTPAARRRAMERIREQPAAQAARLRTDSAPADSSVTDRLAAFFRSLLAPKWAPTAAVALIALQLGVLSWVIQRPEEAQITTRGLDAPVGRVQVTFAPTASEHDIRSLLGEIRGRIVDGPSADGVYLVEVPAADPARLAAKVETLRARADLVRLAQPVSP